MKTETGEIISKKEALVREAMECGFQRFEAEAFYNCLRKFQQREREACAVAAEKESLRGLPEEQPEGEELLRACAQIAGGVLIADAIRARGQA